MVSLFTTLTILRKIMQGRGVPVDVILVLNAADFVQCGAILYVGCMSCRVVQSLLMLYA